MDVQCREAMRALQQHCPKVAEWAARMLDGEYSAGEIKSMVPGLIDMAKEHGVDCLRAFLIILRCIAAKFPKLWRAIAAGQAAATATSTGAAGGTAAGGAAGGTAAGGSTTGGTAAGGAAAGGAAFWASLLFLLFALGFLSWRVLNELYADLDIDGEGVMPCVGGPHAATLALMPRELTTGSMWGRKASLQAAIDEANADAERLSSNCTGTCPGGMTCRAVVAVQSVEQWSTFPWFVSYTRLIYTCPCYCC